MKTTLNILFGCSVSLIVFHSHSVFVLFVFLSFADFLSDSTNRILRKTKELVWSGFKTKIFKEETSRFSSISNIKVDTWRKLICCLHEIGKTTSCFKWRNFIRCNAKFGGETAKKRVIFLCACITKDEINSVHLRNVNTVFSQWLPSFSYYSFYIFVFSL